MELADADNQFSFEVPPGTCIALPAAKRDPQACAGLNLGAVDRMADPAMRALAFVDDAGQKLGIAVSHQSAGGSGTMSREGLDEFMQGARSAAEKQGGSIDPHELVEIGGAPGWRFLMRSGEERILQYALQGKHGISSVSFVTDEAHLQQTRATAERIMKTARTVGVDANLFARPRAEQLGYLFGKMLFPIVLVIALLVVGIQRWRKRRVAS